MKISLKNFKSIGERMELNAEHVALIYLLKHMDSIRNYVLNGKEASEEPIIGRIQDARNYLLLLGGIIAERKKHENLILYSGLLMHLIAL
jgi:hypothetical protein